MWRNNDFNFSTGGYSVNRSSLEFGFDSICNIEGIDSGSYEWALDGDELTFERIEDDCEGRAFSLTFQPWLKQYVQSKARLF